ncbi:MAG: Hsp20 family protein [Candidatus Omnitrophica bacterium]|nr:Hsp20 family protein [Candidatus Omnitrophota bacterium]
MTESGTESNYKGKIQGEGGMKMDDKKNKNLPETWQPVISEMMNLRKQMDDMFNSFFTTPASPMKIPSFFKGERWAWRPEVDMYETKKQVVVKANLPGCDKKDVNVEVEDNVLTIKGKKEEDKEVKEKDFYHKEQRFGSFQRTISLPRYADVDKPRVKFKNGVLELKFPKTKTSSQKAKKINIK